MTDFAKYNFLEQLGLQEHNVGVFNGKEWKASGETSSSLNPHNNKVHGTAQNGTLNDYEDCMSNMLEGSKQWKMMPAPARGNIVRKIGEELKKNLNTLGALTSLEMGKILGEGIGEVQEAIDICEFACGLSRAINGQIIPSERPNHQILEQWNPLGIVAVISAFNFPCAVYFWNLALSMITGNMTIWKPAPSTPLISIALIKIVQRVLEEENAPVGVVTLCCGGVDIGQKLSQDKRVNLLSFTGSSKIGQIVQNEVLNRWGKCLLELGGNGATIIHEDANLELAIKGSVFGAIGTCGQRCTSLRRLIVHEKHYEDVKAKLIKIYGSVCIGDPLDSKTLVGPLHSKLSIKIYTDGIEEIKKQGGKILTGGKVIDEMQPGNYVLPTLVEIDHSAEIVQTELFCPILYIFKYKTLDEAIEMNNSVPQGLSSSLYSDDIKNVFRWIGPLGSDCGIVNTNIGTSGAEIGGAFGGEKETGGGRESGSDSWKQYMRRSTCTINYGTTLPLAQGLKFDF